MANTSDTLFPILQPRLTALGRAAADAEQIDVGHDVRFRALESRSILNKSVSKRLHWMAWSINPYRGCEFGCRYCYARYTHEFLEGLPDESASADLGLRAPEAFEREIFVKQNAAWLLEQDLRRLAKQNRLHEEIALGTATDPWQPIERRTGLTRSLLEVMARKQGLRLGIVTKSTLIERDIDLLQEIDRQSTLVVHITVTTPDAELARKLEPRAPRPDLRLRTVQRLREAGIRTGILNSPLLPGITDGPTEIDRMAQLAKEVDASFFAAMPLFLKSCSRPTYFQFIRDHFPHLQAEHLERFRNMDFADRPYRERLNALVQASCRRYGLRERLTDALLTRDAGNPNATTIEHRSSSIQGRTFATQNRTAGVKKPSASDHVGLQGSLFALN
jgi:DNA repair photolyase